MSSMRALDTRILQWLEGVDSGYNPRYCNQLYIAAHNLYVYLKAQGKL